MKSKKKDNEFISLPIAGSTISPITPEIVISTPPPKAMNLSAEDALTEDIVASDDCTKHPQRIQIQQHTFMGMAWCGAWLFTIGYLHLSFWRGLLAILLWPYYIGVHFSALTH